MGGSRPSTTCAVCGLALYVTLSLISTAMTCVVQVASMWKNAPENPKREK